MQDWEHAHGCAHLPLSEAGSEAGHRTCSLSACPGAGARGVSQRGVEPHSPFWRCTLGRALPGVQDADWPLPIFPRPQLAARCHGLAQVKQGKWAPPLVSVCDRPLFPRALPCYAWAHSLLSFCPLCLPVASSSLRSLLWLAGISLRSHRVAGAQLVELSPPLGLAFGLLSSGASLVPPTWTRVR